jgi:uncharacterized membrane protein
MATHRRASAVVATVFSMLVQAALIVLGLEIVLIDASDVEIFALLGIWCGIGVLYTITVLIVLGRTAKRRAAKANAPARFEVSSPVRIVSIVATIVPSLIGLIAAIMVVTTDAPDDFAVVADVVGVSAALVAWGLMHWGFAQIYYQRYHHAMRTGAGRTISFPETDHPGIVDFVYFAFTVGASFAASDATVLTTRARWLVTWHTVISFFFNGLIIVFALTTIMSR